MQETGRKSVARTWHASGALGAAVGVLLVCWALWRTELGHGDYACFLAVSLPTAIVLARTDLPFWLDAAIGVGGPVLQWALIGICTGGVLFKGRKTAGAGLLTMAGLVLICVVIAPHALTNFVGEDEIIMGRYANTILGVVLGALGLAGVLLTGRGGSAR